jgi:dolichol-phosphate mannosyltransferase
LWQNQRNRFTISSNFILHDAFTYRGQRRTGWPFVTGLLRFYMIAILGAVPNIGFSNWIFSNENIWWVAGLSSAILGLIWNHVAAFFFISRVR